LVLLLLVLTPAVFAGWTTCDGKNDGTFRVDSVTQSPPSFKKGDTFSFTVVGEALKSFGVDPSNSGTMHFDTAWNGWPIGSEDKAFCEVVKLSTDAPCPWNAGPITWTNTGTVPSTAPGGAYTERFTFKDQTGAFAFCVEGTFTLA